MYKPTERNIYEYWDGEAERVIDPLAVLWKLGSQSKLLADISVSDTLLSGNIANLKPSDLAALQNVVDFVRSAFGIKPLGKVDGKLVGLGDSEVLQLLQDFSMFNEDLKKKPLTSATSFVPMAASDCPTIQPTLACG